MSDKAIHALPADSTDAALALLDAAQAADGARALSEQGELALIHRRPGVDHFAVQRDSEVIGYLQLTPARDGQPAGAEGVVHPAHRRSGLGRALLRAALTAAGGPLLVWAHGGGEPAKAFLTGAGGTRVRRLLQMRRELDPITVPSAALPGGMRVRPFVVGQDEEAFLALNAATFAYHPEQGRMTMADLRDRLAEPWFDPAGFLLAEKVSTGELLGFHWTKVHPATATQPAIGEVYVVGVSPSGQGHGLGRTLVVLGLAHLASAAATPTGPVSEVVLYVEADNASALAVYTGLRFTIAHVDEQYRLG